MNCVWFLAVIHVLQKRLLLYDFLTLLKYTFDADLFYFFFKK